MLSKSEIRRVRLAADLIAKHAPYVIEQGYDSSHVPYACEALGWGHLATKMKTFYQPPMQNREYPSSDCWGDLPYNGGHTKQSQLQRELMLELFAHLKGKI